LFRFYWQEKYLFVFYIHSITLCIYNINIIYIIYKLIIIYLCTDYIHIYIDICICVCMLIPRVLIMKEIFILCFVCVVELCVADELSFPFEEWARRVVSRTSTWDVQYSLRYGRHFLPHTFSTREIIYCRPPCHLFEIERVFLMFLSSLLIV